jgi:hypothetical protein
MVVKGKPQAISTWYNGTHFRSRLEARWAAFFDRAEWRWTYEPDELDGYIPDFKLWLRVPVLVEVKPVQWDESNEDDDILCAARTKIINSGFRGEAIILGSRIVHERLAIHQQIGGIMQVDPQTDEATPWNPMFGFRCEHCGRHSFADDVMSWHCRVKGCYEGSGHLGAWDADLDFRFAGSEVQWSPR